MCVEILRLKFNLHDLKSIFCTTEEKNSISQSLHSNKGLAQKPNPSSHYTNYVPLYIDYGCIYGYKIHVMSQWKINLVNLDVWIPDMSQTGMEEDLKVDSGGQICQVYTA